MFYTPKQGRTNFSLFGLWFNVIRLLVIPGPVTVVTLRHRRFMMHEIDANKATEILIYTPQFDTASSNKGYNVRLGTRRKIDDDVKHVTINRMCRNITVF